MDDREKSPGAPDAQISPPKVQPKFEHLPKRFFSQMFSQALSTYPFTGCPKFSRVLQIIHKSRIIASRKNGDYADPFCPSFPFLLRFVVIPSSEGGNGALSVGAKMTINN
jgi:hypothetical protein